MSEQTYESMQRKMGLFCQNEPYLSISPIFQSRSGSFVKMSEQTYESMQRKNEYEYEYDYTREDE